MNKFQEGLATQRKIVEQLRNEAAVQRMPVSECVAEIMKFCDQHQENDVLIKGFAKQNDNPFKEKGGCLILWGLASASWMNSWAMGGGLQQTCVELGASVS